MGRFFELPPAGHPSHKSTPSRFVAFLFLVFGCVLLLRIPYLFHQKSRLDDGVEVPAKILRVKSVSSGGGTRGGGNGASSVSVDYEFQLNGQVIKGDRASIFSDSSGLYSRLHEAFESGREVTCFVDPADPSLNALEKDVRLFDVFGYLILGSAFGSLGAIILFRSFSREGNRGRR